MRWFFLAFLPVCLGIGCIRELCRRNAGGVLEMEFRKCYSRNSDGSAGATENEKCGRFRSKRWDGSAILDKIDIHCEPGNQVLAPFDAEITSYSAYGFELGSDLTSGSNWDDGLSFRGLGSWEGYQVDISHFAPIRTSGTVKKGDVVGFVLSYKDAGATAVHTGLDREDSNDFLQITMLKHGTVIDPTHHFFNCSCTDTICETNARNELKHPGPQSHERFGWGYSISCPDAPPRDESEFDSEEEGPFIYAPIDGERMGRVRTIRPNEVTQSYQCHDDGLFITGTGAWENFEVRLYNVQLLTATHNTEKVAKGAKIAKRLRCEGVEIDEIFMEVRYRGRLVDFGSQLSGRNCSMAKITTRIDQSFDSSGGSL